MEIIKILTHNFCLRQFFFQTLCDRQAGTVLELIVSAAKNCAYQS